MTLAVILPSRGLIHKQVLAAVDRETAGRDHRRFWSHDKKIPDCFNVPTAKAYDSGAQTFWFVEEDTVPAIGSLDALLNSGSFAACPYRLHPFDSPSWRRQLDLCWTGLGCTVVRREVLDALMRPWFWIGYEIVRVQPGSGSKDYWELRSSRSQYAGHEVAFSYRAHCQGFQLKILEDFPAFHIPKKEKKDERASNVGTKEFHNHLPDRRWRS